MLATIKHNDTGDLVKVARYLTGNCDRNAADGTFDAAFVSFICSYQSNNGLTADGVIGPKTWSKMASKAPTCSTSKNSKSAAACALQILLGGVTVDGVFGSKTKKAVAAFQSAKGLTADGVCGPKTWAALVGSSSTSSGSGSSGSTSAGQTTSGGKTLNNCVHYLQWDSKWKNKKYSTHTSSQTIGNSGCGPSSMAMIMATFIDPKITPVEMCELSVANGFRTYSNGTSWGFYEFVFKKYKGFKKFIKTSNVETLIAALAQGALAVCSMNSNDNNFWTKGGHFITAIGFDDAGYIYANDPNKSSAPRKQKKDKFKSCMKQAFIFWPEVKEETADPFEPVDGDQSTGSTDTPAPARGSLIIDISKWQPTVNYDKFIKATSLIILRTGYRGTGGGIKIDQCFVKHADALKQRGVRFGTYFYSIAKDENMAREEARMYYKWAKEYKPLFWALDVEKSEITHDAIAAFIDELRKLGVTRAGCYVAHNLYQKYEYGSLRILFDFTWIPRYGKNDGTVEGSKEPNFECDVWQYTSTGKVDGISGNVDVNIITGTGKTLEWFLGGDAV